MHMLLTPTSHAELEIAAKELSFSGYYVDQSEAYLKMLLGVSLGLTIFESLHGIAYEAGAGGKPGKVIVEPFTLIERVVGRSDSYEVKVVHSDEMGCALNFFQNAKIKGQHSLTREDLAKRNIQSSTTSLFQVAYAQGVQKFFPHLFGHKFFLRVEVPSGRQPEVEAIVQGAGEKVLTADKLTIPRHPRKLALAEDSQKLLDWQQGYQKLNIEKPQEWDVHLAKLLGFSFLTEPQKDELFDELLGHGINYGVEYNADKQRFYLTHPANA